MLHMICRMFRPGFLAPGFRSAVQLRGLPYRATTQDVKDTADVSFFFSECQEPEQGVTLW